MIREHVNIFLSGNGRVSTNVLGDKMVHRHGWRWGWHCKGPGRPPKPRIIGFIPSKITFIPYDENGVPIRNAPPVEITPDELEAMRLVYFEGLTQEDAAKKMGVSRGTLWRALNNGRRKVVQALIERRPIAIVK